MLTMRLHYLETAQTCILCRNLLQSLHAQTAKIHKQLQHHIPVLHPNLQWSRIQKPVQGRKTSGLFALPPVSTRESCKVHPDVQDVNKVGVRKS